MKRAVRRAGKRDWENWRVRLRGTRTMVTQITSYKGQSAPSLKCDCKESKEVD